MSELHQVWPDPLAAPPLVPTCEGHMGFESLALMLQGSRGVLAINVYAPGVQRVTSQETL